MQYRKELVHRALTCLTLAVFLTTMLLTPAVSSAQNPVQRANATSLVQGTVTNAAGQTGTFSGLLQVSNFVVQNGQLVANGVLNGTATVGGTTTSIVNQAVQVPLQTAAASCTILDLTLGPLHLNLLGLVIDLNQVHLTITAQPGPGNLLGNLLCSVANLLNGGGTLSNLLNQLAVLLNQILGAL